MCPTMAGLYCAGSQTQGSMCTRRALRQLSCFPSPPFDTSHICTLSTYCLLDIRFLLAIHSALMGAMLLSDLISKHPPGETNASKISLAAPVITNPKTVQHFFFFKCPLQASFGCLVPERRKHSPRGGWFCRVRWSRMLTAQQQPACWIISCHICSHLETVGRKASACSPKSRLLARAPACRLPDGAAAAP